MEIKRVYSHYKIFGGFGLLLVLTGAVGFGLFKLLTSSKISIDKVDLLHDQNAFLTYSFVFALFVLFLVLFTTQNRFIIADREKIVLVNPLIPFLRKTYEWADFDYYVTVDEYSQYSTHEAVWLVKNGRLKVRFSSFYYSNYEDLLNQVGTTSISGKYFGPFDQLFILLGLKKIAD